MIHALRYEPRGQRQRFEPREQQSGELGNKHIHFHLHLHLHLNLGMHIRHSSRFLRPTAVNVTRIFAAWIGALSMALSFFIMSGTTFPFMWPHIDLAGNLVLIGALLGSGAVLLGGIPLLVSAWRLTPRSRVLLWTPCYVFGLATILLFIPFLWFGRSMSTSFVNALLLLFFYGVPLLSTIGLNRGIRQATIPDKWLRFTAIPSLLVVCGMLFMIGGMLLWGGTVAFFLPAVFPQILSLLTSPTNSWLLQLLGMIIALVVMLRALFSRPRSSAEARPKDDSPSGFDSSPEPRGYRG